MVRFKVHSSSRVSFSIKSSTTQVGMTTKNAEVVYKESHKYYEGSYVVEPDIIPQSLPTRDKIMREDVSISEIPVYEVSNSSGGVTATIGGIKYAVQ